MARCQSGGFRTHGLVLSAFVAATALIVTLTAVRIAAKLTNSLVLSLGVQAVVLVLLLAAVVWFARISEDETSRLQTDAEPAS